VAEFARILPAGQQAHLAHHLAGGLGRAAPALGRRHAGLQQRLKRHGWLGFWGALHWGNLIYCIYSCVMIMQSVFSLAVAG